jgi:hypothetical protein
LEANAESLHEVTLKEFALVRALPRPGCLHDLDALLRSALLIAASTARRTRAAAAMGGAHGMGIEGLIGVVGQRAEVIRFAGTFVPT